MGNLEKWNLEAKLQASAMIYLVGSYFGANLKNLHWCKSNMAFWN